MAARCRRGRLSRLRPLACVGLVCMVAACAQAAHAEEDDRGRARALGEEGILLYRNGEFEAALGRFNEAEAIFHAPTLALRAARCLERLGKWVAAAERYERAASMPIDESLTTEFQEAQSSARVSAMTERRALRERTPTLTIRVLGEEPDEIKLDDQPLPAGAGDRVVSLDPGLHSVVVKQGDVVRRHELTLVERDAIVLPVDLPKRGERPLPQSVRPPAETPTKEDSGASAFVIAGATLMSGAGLASTIGIGAWVVAADAGDELDERCPERICDTRTLGDDGEAALARQRDGKTAMIASFVSAGALATTGAIVLALMPGKREPQPSNVVVSLSPTGLRLRGEF